MNYLNAKDVLPEELLKEIRKYADGMLLYVPKADGEEKTWGELSGQKLYYRKRNRMILNKFQYGISIQQLAEEYHLSIETIKKIAYSKKNLEEHIFYPDINSAKEYSKDSLLEEWIHTYLLFERKNKGFSDGLYKADRFYLGPLAMPLELFQRNCGSEEGMKWQVEQEVFELRVDEWMERIDLKQTLPPIIVGYEAGQFEINCNSPLFEALIRKEITYFPMIVWCSSKEDYDGFRNKYVAYTKFALN